ncbi:hypothetical protein BJV82DRAFT_594732, partial [Fennellomyces sp. T-0311]
MAQPTFTPTSTLVKTEGSRTVPKFEIPNFNGTIKSFEKGKRAYAKGKYRRATEYYNCALDALQDEFLSAINDRLSVFYKLKKEYDIAEFEKILYTGDTWFKSAPSDTKVSLEHLALPTRFTLDNGSHNPYSPLLKCVQTAAKLMGFRLSWLTLADLSSFDPPATNLIDMKDYPSLMGAVDKHCLVLRAFNYGTVTRLKDQSLPFSGGLSMLQFHPPKSARSTGLNANVTLDRWFRKWRRSLRVLSLDLDILENGQFSALETLTRCGHTRIKVLLLNASSKCAIGSQAITRLIYRCPWLTELSLTGTQLWHDQIYYTLANSKCLEILYIRENRCVSTWMHGEANSTITPKAFLYFFKHATALRFFSYSFPTDLRKPPILSFTFQLSEAIAMSNVHTLELPVFALTCETLPPFVENLRSSQIRTLKVSVSGPIEDELVAFVQMEHLTELIIEGISTYQIKLRHVYQLF